MPQFRFTFTTAQFDTIVPWLMFNRQGLDVLVHPLTDSSFDDHSRYAVWLGTPVALSLNGLRGYRAEQYPQAEAAHGRVSGGRTSRPAAAYRPRAAAIASRQGGERLS